MILTNEILIRLPQIKKGKKFIENVNQDALAFFLDQTLSPFFQSEGYDLITTKDGFQIIKLDTLEEFYLKIEEAQMIFFHCFTNDILGRIQKDEETLESIQIKQENKDIVETHKIIDEKKEVIKYSYEERRNGVSTAFGTLSPLNMAHNAKEYFSYRSRNQIPPKNWLQKLVNSDPIIPIQLQYGKYRYQTIFEKLEESLKKEAPKIERSKKEAP